MGALDTAILPTAADIEAAAKRLAGVAVRTPLINAPVLDERARRAGVPESRDAAAHRLVQVPRRL